VAARDLTARARAGDAGAQAPNVAAAALAPAGHAVKGAPERPAGVAVSAAPASVAAENGGEVSVDVGDPAPETRRTPQNSPSTRRLLSIQV
jgi:hypothetical protein